jgi:two-component system, repressor protein LuxO
LGTLQTRDILLIDDSDSLASLYAQALEEAGFQTTIAHSGEEALKALDTNAFAPSLLVLDIKLPDIDGLSLLATLRARGFDAPVIVITGHGSIHIAIEAMRAGASDFLIKPFPIEKLCESAARALQAAGLSTKASLAENRPQAKAQDVPAASTQKRQENFGGFIGVSPPMQMVYDVIQSAARSTAPVFITGESGTGKELCAQALHQYSNRARAPFIAINCAAVPRELLESELFGHVKGAFTNAHADRDGAVAQARGGTLFLDEIADMAPDMQTKLLRFLQNFTYRKVGGNAEYKADIRVVCATNKDPLEEIRKNTLRQDLYYRLHVIPVHVPPLRERPGDVLDLARYFLRTQTVEEKKNFKGFSNEAESYLLSQSWPGNVRQLQNMIRSVVVLNNADIVTRAMLPASEDALPLNGADVVTKAGIAPLWQVERTAIEKAIAVCEGNIPKAAAMLEISPSTIYRKKMFWEKQPASSNHSAY